MPPNSTHERSSSIILNKRVHKGTTSIFLEFRGRRDWLVSVKKLSNIKYSRTIGSWYIPYTNKAYNEFRKLNITFEIVDSTVTTEDIASQGDNNGIDTKVSHSVISTDDIVSRTDIHEETHGLKITYNSNKFFIKLPYDQVEVSFLKSLDNSWWHSTSSSWIVRATISNLHSIQHRYNCWTNEKYIFIDEAIKKVNEPCQVELYLNPALKEKFCVKVKGYNLDIAYLKNIVHRSYNTDTKIWTLPYDQKIIERLIEHYKSKGTKIVNRIPHKGETYSTTRAPYLEVQKRLINKLKGEEKELLKLYIDTMTAHRYSVATIKQYSSAFLKYIQYYSSYPIAKHTEVEVNRYLAQLSKKNLSFSTLNITLSAVKFYFEKVIFLQNFDIRKLKRPRKGRSLPTIISISEVDRLLRSCENLKHVTILYTLYSSGIRLSEMLNIKVADIHWDRNQIHIKSGKGNKDRMVMLSEVLKTVLMTYFDQYTPIYWLFEGQDGKSQYSSSSVQKLVKNTANKAGITRKVTPHTLRHCFATHLLDNGTDIRYIQELLGHKDIKTTLIYTHVTTRQLQNIQSPLDNLLLDRNKTDKNRK